jgi:Kef-type K+ transport system membrane component KefB
MDIHITLITLGALFVIGLATDEIGRRTRLPRVTLLILLGVLAGPIGFDVLPPQVNGWYELLATMALTMVAFLLGGALSLSHLRRHGRQILMISLAVVVTTVIVVAGGLIALNVTPALALLLAGIATATAPAATQDVIKQAGAKGDFTETLQGIVAIDDAWGLLAFSLILIVVDAMAGNGTTFVLQRGLWELGGAIAVGVGTGLPAAYLTGRLRPGEPIQIEALAIVCLCAGISVWLQVSFLLSGVVAGIIVVNFAEHHTRPFHEIEHIEWPFMILFFFLAGVSLDTNGWRDFGLIIVGLLVLRTISRIAGGWMGATMAGAPKVYRRWMGAALLPQAGVAVGMALVAGNSFPELREVVLSVTIGATVVFEIFGPFVTLVALNKAGETSQLGPQRE